MKTHRVTKAERERIKKANETRRTKQTAKLPDEQCDFDGELDLDGDSAAIIAAAEAEFDANEALDFGA